jgi:drug/metabolite transporter (DMT)-like permease
MAKIVYALCGATSVACALLLARGYFRTRTRLLLWSALCFIGLAINNALLFVDLVIFPEIDLSIWRGLAAVIGMGCLLYGMIWDLR